MSEIADGLNIAAIDISASGDNTVIAGQSGRIISVYRVKMSLAVETTVQIKSGSRALSGPETMAAQVLDYSDQPYYRTGAGEALVVSLGTSTQCGGSIWYRIN